MSVRNTASLTQVPFNYQGQLTTANTNYTSPSNTIILAQAGPDGSDIWGLAAVANANQSSANQVQLFISPDGGTTFNFLPLTAAIASGNITQTAGAALVNFNHTNGVPLGPTNPFVLGGRGGGFTYPMTNSVVTESTSYYKAYAPTTGTANAQTQAICFNASGTQLAAGAAGVIVDFQAGLTTTTTGTLAFGAQTGQTAKRSAQGAAPANLAAGDLTAGFWYRAIWDVANTQWLVLITDRLYAAIGETQGVTVSCWGAHR